MERRNNEKFKKNIITGTKRRFLRGCGFYLIVSGLLDTGQFISHKHSDYERIQDDTGTSSFY
jgi:hypothetical protein